MNSPIKHTHLRYIRFFLFFILLCFFNACEDEPFDANSGTFTDERDGHEYNWVKIGEQIWMAENLAYVPYVCAPDSQCGIWIYGYYGEGSYGVNYHTYGCLYDWETAKQVCPEGWHLPSDEEWMELERFLGMPENQLDRTGIRGLDENIGGKLKDIGNSFWLEPNKGAANYCGFAALPGGDSYGRFGDLSESACFWTSSLVENNYAFNRILHFQYGEIFRYEWEKKNGLSIRCVKN